ncbi:MAG: S-formylglutathione hydrolase, partial [Marinobacter sp.]|nr:S-formylglutathione hydrolase [Marinobacter sp.]
MELLSSNLCFDGEHRRYRHTAATLECKMEFAVFLPPAAIGDNAVKVPVLYWLSGLT